MSVRQNAQNNYGSALATSMNYNPNVVTRSKKNVATVTYSSAGKYIVNFTTAYPNAANYVAFVSQSGTSIPNNIAAAYIDSATAAQTTTTIHVANTAQAYNAAATYADQTYFTLAILGTL